MENLAFLGNAVLVVLGISLLVVVHEFGHFIVAKITGIKVDEFMLGLPGPRIFSFKIGETTYGATYVFLGGYVKYAGMDPFERVTDEEEARGFNAQPAWKKLSSVVMGPVMNLVLCAFLLTIVLSLYGLWQTTTIIDKTLPKYPAKKAGLKSGDKIVTIEGEKIESWADITDNIQPNPNKEVEIKIEREGQRVKFDVTLDKRDGKGFLGIQPKNKRERQSLPAAFLNGVKMTGQWTVGIFRFLCVALPELLIGKTELFAEGARGPVGIVVETHRAVSQNVFGFIYFLAGLSASLAVVNAFPIPPLDGGRFLVLGIEAIRRKSISTKAIMATNAIGLALVLLLFIYLIVADVQRYKLIQAFLKLISQVAPGM